MKKDKSYWVLMPIRGTQSISVTAKSKSEAYRKAEMWADGNMDGHDAEGANFEVDWHGKAYGAIEQKA